MEKSESIKTIAFALNKVQSKLQPAKKDSENPFFKSSYADLTSVWATCRTLLAENGLSVSQLNLPSTDGVIVETVLMHESGEWISGSLFLPLAKTDPQGVGSAITYGRRYGLSAILGIVSDEDDDGNKASQAPTTIKGQVPTQPKMAGKPTDPLTDGQRQKIFAIAGEEIAREICQGMFNSGSIRGLNQAQASSLINEIQAHVSEK